MMLSLQKIGGGQRDAIKQHDEQRQRAAFAVANLDREPADAALVVAHAREVAQRPFGLVRESPRVMLSWGAFIAVLLFLAMLPGFLGLLVVLPVLGHATWHLYSQVIVWEPGADPSP